MTTYTLRYRSTRAEVWGWYWRTWRSRLWRIHAVFAVALGFLMSRLLADLNSPSGWAAASMVAFVSAVATSVLYSQVAFKSAQRILTVDAGGWSTQIGTKAGARKWSETSPVYERAGAIVIENKSGNALLIPNRAFSTASDREQFLLHVKGWQQDVA